MIMQMYTQNDCYPSEGRGEELTVSVVSINKPIILPDLECHPLDEMTVKDHWRLIFEVQLSLCLQVQEARFLKYLTDHQAWSMQNLNT